MTDYPNTEKYPIYGTDISFYQNDDGRVGRVNFEKMRVYGASFVICRAGQRTWPDPLFKEYWANSKGILPRGSYWFYDSRENPKRQAELWVSILGKDLGELPLQADFEDRYGGPFGGWKNLYDFMERVNVLTGNKKQMVYTGPSYWQEFGQDKPYWLQYELWIAHYKTDTPTVPRPWKTWRLWQFTAAGPGRDMGVESNGIDLNYFNGTGQDFKAWAGMVPDAPQKPPEAPDTPKAGKVTLIVPKGQEWEVKEVE